MKLNEIYKPDIRLQPYMYQTKAEIEAWIKKAHFDGFVNRELEIEPAEKSVDLDRFGTGEEDILVKVKGKWVLPVQFKLAINFDLGRLNIGSFIGCPYVVLSNFTAENATVTSLEGLPKMVSNQIMLKFKDTHLKDLTHFPEHCDEAWISDNDKSSTIGSIQGINKDLSVLSIGCGFSDVKEIVQTVPNLVGLWLIKPDLSKKPGFLQVFKLKRLEHFAIGYHNDNAPNTKAVDIIMKHLKSDDRDIMECREELVTNGLKEYARL